MQQRQNTHQSVGRSLEILMVFVPNNQEMGTTDVSKKVGLHRSTVSRLLHALTHHGFLQQNPNNKKYSLGKSAFEIGMAINASFESRIAHIARPHIDALRDTVMESVGFEVFVGDSTILKYSAKGFGMLQVSFAQNTRLPVHVAAGAKAILAFLPLEQVKRIVPKKLMRYTENTITDAKVLLKELEEIRKTGFAFDRGERDIDAHVVGAPIFNSNKKALAAVTIAFPVTRKESLTKPETLKILKETVSKISAEILF